METKKVNQKLLNDLLNDEQTNKGYDKLLQIKQLQKEIDSSTFDQLNDEQKLSKLNLLYKEFKIHIEFIYQKLGVIYNKIFPEIFSILPDPVLIAKAVIAFGDFKDIDQNKLSNFNQKILMNLLMSAMNKNLDELTKEQQDELFQLANDIILYSQKQKYYLQIIQKLIQKIAPNTVQIAGNLITSQLVAQVGGILNLANIPACNIQVIGEKQKSLNGLSKVDVVSHVGFFDQHQLFNKTEVQFRKKLVRFLSNGVAKASKIDAGGYSIDGSIGKKMYEDIIKKFNNVIGPRKRERIKPMKAPGTEQKKRRGGKKYRKMKEDQQITENLEPILKLIQQKKKKMQVCQNQLLVENQKYKKKNTKII